MASIKIYFEGANFFHSQGVGGEASAKPEARRAKTRSLKGREQGWVLGRGQRAPSLPAWGLLSQRGPRKFEIWCNLRPQNVLSVEYSGCRELELILNMTVNMAVIVSHSYTSTSDDHNKVKISWGRKCWVFTRPMLCIARSLTCLSVCPSVGHSR